MVIPNTLKKERNRCVRSACQAIKKLSETNCHSFMSVWMMLIATIRAVCVYVVAFVIGKTMPIK